LVLNLLEETEGKLGLCGSPAWGQFQQHFYSRLFAQKTNKLLVFENQWKGINRKQSTRWQHLSQLKARAFFSLQIFFSCYETQQLILATGTAIWWVTASFHHTFCTKFVPVAMRKSQLAVDIFLQKSGI
jgi:hypothetical protein